MTQAERRLSARFAMTAHILDSILRPLRERLVQNASYLLGVTTIGALTGLIFWTLAARLYSPEHIGLASSVISVVQLLAGVASLGMGLGIVRFLARSERPARMLNASFTLSSLISLLVGGVFLLGVSSWSPSLTVLTTEPAYAAGLFGFIALTALATLLQMAYLANRQVSYSLWSVLIMNALRLGFIVTLVGRGAFGIAAAIALAVAVADGAGIMIFLPRLIKGYRFRLKLPTDVLGKLLPYSTANYLADLLYRAPMLLSPLLALETLGASASAYTYIAWMIAALVASPGLALAQSAFAEGSHLPDDLRPILLRAARYAMGVVLPLAIIAGLAAPWILAIFGQTYVTGATDLLRWLSASAPLVVLASLYFSALRVRKRLGELIRLSALAVVITLAVPLLTMPELGLVSIGIGWLLANSILMAVATYTVLRRRRSGSRLESPAVMSVASDTSVNDQSVLVAIPCHNESGYVADVVRKARRYADRIVVIDDGSTDGTLEAAEAAGAQVVRHPVNLGAGAAARTCLEVGLRSGATVLVTLDGDGQHDANEISEVVAPITRGEADLVIGSRFLGHYNNVAGYRRFGIGVITFLYNFGSREKITDGQSCFRAYSRSALKQLKITEAGFGFSVETLVQARRAGLPIREVSISCIYHADSHSANPILHGVGVALMVVKHRLTRLWKA